MKQLTIKPKEAGTTIKFGKLPIFTRSLTHWLDMDNVVQLKVEGRHYAIEQRPTPPSPLFEAVDKLCKASLGKSDSPVEIPQDDTAKEDKVETEKTTEPVHKSHYQVGHERFEKLKELSRTGELAKCKNRTDICKKMGFDIRRGTFGYNWVSNQIKKGYLSEELVKYDRQNSGEYRYRLTGVEPIYSGNKHIKDKTAKKKAEMLTNELEKLGFTSLSASPKPAPKKDEDLLKPLSRGNLELSQWLKPQDYLVDRLFLYGNGQVSVGKAVTFEDVRNVFMELPYPKTKKKRSAAEKAAGRIASVCLTQLVKKGVLAKEQPELTNKENIFSLTLLKGAPYARKVYYTVSKGMYQKGRNGKRELCDFPS